MILYNVTINIDKEFEQSWLNWIKEKYIPYVMETGLFQSNKFFRLLNETENSGSTYSLQFFTETLDAAEKYLETYAPTITNEHLDAFRHQHVAFMTLLESVE
jgi:hypothetical protein